MPNGCDTCQYHEERGLHLAEQGAKLAAHEVEIGNMKEAQELLFTKFEAAADKNASALKELCSEIKQIKLKLVGPSAPAKPVESEVEKALDSQPIGWLNGALKKAFNNPVFWALVGWALIKIFLFGEFPAFVSKPRPYMAPVIKSQDDIEARRTGHPLTYKFKDANGKVVFLEPVINGEEKK